MKKTTLGVFLSLIMAVALVGCSQPKAENSGAAIDHAKTLENVEEQAKYLVNQAESFIKSEEYDEGIKVAGYVSSNYEEYKAQAQGLIDEAKAELEKLAKAKAEELKTKMKEKLGMGN